MKILDLTAGNRAIWYNKKHPDCLYLDIRPQVCPTIVCDSRCLPESIGNGFDLVVFDPPHVNFGANAEMSKTYGHFTTAEIWDIVARSSKEAARVSKSSALMAFKWNDHDQKLENILKLMPDWEPLFGHLTKNGPGSKTYWVMLKKR